MMFPFINDILEDPSILLYGGKGSSLIKLVSADIPVPKAFIIPTTTFDGFISSFFAKHELDLSFNVDMKFEDAQKLSDTITKSILCEQLGDSFLSSLSASLSKLKECHFVSVRSSSPSEDLENNSFAGMYETLLNIPTTIESVSQAILKCYVSLYSPRALMYRYENHYELITNISLAVIIQEMIPSDQSGVLFTCDPSTSSREHMSLDGVFGQGEALVSGQVETDHWTIRKHFPKENGINELKIVEKHIGTQEYGLYTKEDGGIERQYLGKDGMNACFSNQQIYSICTIGLKIENYYKKPMDIEFAIYNNIIYILQARPITTLFDIPDVINPLSSSFIPTYRCCISIHHIQMSLLPFTPCGFSTINHLLMDSHTYILNINNYMYMDIAPMMKLSITRKLFFNMFKNVDQEMDSIMQEWYINDFSHSSFSSSVSILPMLKCYSHFIPYVLYKIIYNYFIFFNPSRICNDIQSELNVYINDINKLLQPLRQPYSFKSISSSSSSSSTTTTTTLNELYKYPITFPEMLKITRPYFIIASFCEKKIKKILESNSIHNYNLDVIMSGQLENLSIHMDYEIGRLAIYINNINKFNSDFIPKLKSLADKGDEDDIYTYISSLSTSSNTTINEFYSYWIQFMDRFGRRAVSSIQYYLPVARLLYAYREHHKYICISIVDAQRKAILKIAKSYIQQSLLQEKEDIFYLTLTELCEIEKNSSSFSTYIPLIQKRKQSYLVSKTITPPRCILSPYSAFISQSNVSKQKLLSLPSNILLGIPTSSGIVEGKAVVVTDPHHCVLEAGDILIAPATDPGWTPLFLNVSGVAISIGGPLTHGSIVAREMGIPCVVNIHGLLNKVTTGMKVRLDGTQGTLEIIQ
ncbi:hypothetical protein WA158_008154 [Blastocystis sp. Blastoise]